MSLFNTIPVIASLIAIDLLVRLLLTHDASASDIKLKIQDTQTYTYTLEKEYPIGKRLFGGISAIDIDDDNNIIIFHRGDHEWLSGTFDQFDGYLPSRSDPISQETVITIDPKERKVIRAWGRDMFFVPHGLSLSFDKKSIWLTDCGLHQIFKYPIEGPRTSSDKALLTLGVAFEPGHEDDHFCKPTSVADTGDYFFVADGYCNSRIVMFNADGKFLGQFGQSGTYPTIRGQPTFLIPHKIVYAKEFDMICVADRENGRIQCFYFRPKIRDNDNTDINQGGGVLMNKAISPAFTIADPLFNRKLFSIDYSPYMGGILVAVSGTSSVHNENVRPSGFVYNVTTRKRISQFQPPSGKSFGMSHDLVITNGNAESIYVVDVSPVNLWKFSRRFYLDRYPSSGQIIDNSSYMTAAKLQLSQANSVAGQEKTNISYILYPIIILLFILIIYGLSKKNRRINHGLLPNSFTSLYGDSHMPSIGFFRGARIKPRGNPRAFLSTLFTRRAFYGIVGRNSQQNDDFSRVPLEESDHSGGDKSDSDVEEFNINQATTSIKIDV